MWKRASGVLVGCLVLAGCGVDCPTALPSSCGGLCTDLSSDPRNCGGCGNVCASGASCNNGACQPACTAPAVLCGAVCSDRSTDARNCGACGNVCPAEAACLGGTCIGGPVPQPGAVPSYTIVASAGVSVPESGYVVTGSLVGSFRLVWTGAGTGGPFGRFYGSIYTAGQFSNVKPGCDQSTCRLEAGDVVAAARNVSGGQRIDFDARGGPADNFDGLDFVVNSEPVYFDLYLDGTRYPQRAFFASRALNGAVAVPASIPFGLLVQ